MSLVTDSAAIAAVSAQLAQDSAQLAADVAATPSTSNLTPSVHSDIFRNALGPTKVLAMLQQLGVKATRAILPGYTIRANGYSAFDAIVASLVKAKIDLTACTWDNNVPAYSSPQFAPWVVTQATFWGATAARYKGQIGKYELWNEENLVVNGFTSAAAYAAWEGPVYNAIKEADPDALIYTGGVGSLVAVGAGNTPGIQFFEQFAALNQPYDGVCVHPYQPQSPPTLVSQAPAQNTLADVVTLSGIVPAGKGMWITEFGYPNVAGLADPAIAPYLALFFDITRTQLQRVTQAAWFLINEYGTSSSGFITSGCFDANGNITDVGRALQAITGAPVTT